MIRISTIFTLLFASLSALPAADDANVDAARHSKFAGLLHNEDCTDFFGYQDCTAGKAGEAVDEYVEVLAGAGVSVLMLNTNARRTNYRSQMWEAFWDGYDPDGPDDQPFRLSDEFQRELTFMLQTCSLATPGRDD